MKLSALFVIPGGGPGRYSSRMPVVASPTHIAADYFQESRSGRNIRHHLLPLLRQSIYSRLAGYDDTNPSQEGPNVLPKTQPLEDTGFAVFDVPGMEFLVQFCFKLRLQSNPLLTLTRYETQSLRSTKL